MNISLSPQTRLLIVSACLAYFQYFTKQLDDAELLVRASAK